MTRQFNQRIYCQHCGQHTTEESPFERWVRNHDDLKSEAGIVRFDLDMLLHRYMGLSADGSREVQAMMFIETKTRMGKQTKCQDDTFGMLNQVLRNRDRALELVASKSNRRLVRLRLFGGHLLQMNGSSPADSSLLLWDGTHELNEQNLVELLRFERDPDNPQKILETWLDW